MAQGTLNDSFDETIYWWSLEFRNPEDERMYTQEMLANPPTPYMMKVVAVIVIVISVLYRFVALCATTLSLGLKTAGLQLELIFCMVVVVAALLELTLCLCNSCRGFQGAIIYTTLNCITTTAAFYTQRAPVFGIMYRRM